MAKNINNPVSRFDAYIIESIYIYMFLATTVYYPLSSSRASDILEKTGISVSTPVIASHWTVVCGRRKQQMWKENQKCVYMCVCVWVCFKAI